MNTLRRHVRKVTQASRPRAVDPRPDQGCARWERRGARPSALALGTEVAVSPPDLDRIDGGPAPSAWQPPATVHLELGLELAWLAEQVDVGLVVQGGPTEADGVLHHLAHGPVQAADLL